MQSQFEKISVNRNPESINMNHFMVAEFVKAILLLLGCLAVSSRHCQAQDGLEHLVLFSDLPINSPGLFTLGYTDKTTGGVSLMAFSLSHPISEGDVGKMEKLPFRLADSSSVLPRRSNFLLHKLPDTMRPGKISTTIDEIVGASITMVVGRDFLSGKSLSMDVDYYMLTTQKPPRESTTYPATFDNHVPTVNIDIGGRMVTTDIVLDGDVDLVLSAELVQTLLDPFNFQRVELDCTYDLDKKGLHWVYFVPTLRVGNVELNRIRVAVSKDSRNRMCLPLLRRLETIIEIDDTEIVLKVPMARKRFAHILDFRELECELHNMGLLVTKVPNWSILQEYFEVGDILLTVSGTKTTNMPIYQSMSKMIESERSTVTILRDGRELELKVTIPFHSLDRRDKLLFPQLVPVTERAKNN